MTKTERLAAIFGIAFAIAYAPTMDFNWTFATYHPIQGIWQLLRNPPLGGGSPAMYWYGFVITSALVAAAVTGIAALLPDSWLNRIPWRTLSWLIPILSIVYIGYVLLPYATKT